MTLKGLRWTPRGLRGQTRETLRGIECGMWFLPWGQPSVVMTWMVDWMVEVLPWGLLSL